MVTSRSVPQQTAQIFSPLAGQKRAALRFSQIGQNTESPKAMRTIQQNTPRRGKRQKAEREGSGHDDFVLEAAGRAEKKKPTPPPKHPTPQPTIKKTPPP